jgi:hypothetical protein
MFISGHFGVDNKPKVAEKLEQILYIVIIKNG